MMMGPENAISVSDLNRQIKEVVERSFPTVWVRGEISNLRRQPSGHCYFSLKDEGGQISSVLFRGNALRVECEPADGKQVVAFGEVSVYEPRGSYQVIVRELLEDGVGRLQREFEALKERLRKEGLFEEARKKSLPEYPLTVGVITSPSGAAIRDMISVFERMEWRGNLRIFPSAVQGNAAIPKLIRQIERAGSMEELDLLVLARGGGSLEDLWCFNDEKIARALAACPVATISAIGHETDVVLTDFVADLRRETPTGAAEWISSLISVFNRRLSQSGQLLLRATRHSIQKRTTAVGQIEERLSLRPLVRRLESNSQRLDDFRDRLVRAVDGKLQYSWVSLAQARKQLAIYDPTKILGVRQKEKEEIQRRLKLIVQRRFESKKEALSVQLRSLRSGGLAHNLKRGFVIVRDSSGKPITRSEHCRSERQVSLQFHDGTIGATVEGDGGRGTD
ncbi:MAG: exodeoxyribonuclease VII large subunit [Verrucomicrobiota bacterium]